MRESDQGDAVLDGLLTILRERRAGDRLPAERQLAEDFGLDRAVSSGARRTHIERLDPHDGLPTWPEPRRLPDHELQKYMRHVPPPEGFHFVEAVY